MKKILGLILALVLGLMPLAALAAKGDMNLLGGDRLYEEYNDGVNSVCAMGDTLYLGGSRHLFTYRLGDAEMTAYEFEIPEAGENENRNLDRIFSDGEKLYWISSVFSMGENYSLDRMELFEVTLEDGKAVFSEPKPFGEGTYPVTSYDGSSKYPAQVVDLCVVKGYLCMSVYDDMGSCKVYALPLSGGEGKYAEVENVVQIAPWSEGRLLVESFDYNVSRCEFMFYDPETEALTPACDPINLEEGNYNYYTGLAYGPDSGRTFFLDDGYLKATKDFDFANAEPVAELSDSMGDNRAGMMLTGEYYAYYTYNNTAIRNTQPGSLPQQRIAISNSGYNDAINAAYFSFTNGRDDVAVVLSDDYMDDAAIIESMMNRDANADILVLNVSRQAYSALYDRGYMVEMENPEIVSAVERMYPAVQKAIMRDGKVVAVPVSVYGWTLGVDYAAFEKLGVAKEDIPTNWVDFLHLLNDLAGKLPEDGSVTAFGEYMTQEDVRRSLTENILQSYQLYMSQSDAEISYDTPELRAILEALDQLDLAGLGVPEETPEEGGTMAMARSVIVTSADEPAVRNLVEFYVGCTLGNLYSESQALPLSISADVPGMLPLDLTVAFVNPFSKNVELAQEFLAEVMKNLDTTTRYTISDEYNEPVRSRYYEQNLKNYQESIDQTEAQLETAEEVDKPVIEEDLRRLREGMAEYEKESWDVKAEDIEWYRGLSDQLAVQQYNYMYSGDNSETYDLIQQYVIRKIDPATLLKEIDKKVRMMILEGN